jgi:predicted dehydrogenase
VYTASVEHADIVERCAERGLPVFVEKPMATI